MGMHACISHVRFRTCEVGVVLHVFTRVGDTCDVLLCAMARACEFDIAMLSCECVDDAR